MPYSPEDHDCSLKTGASRIVAELSKITNTRANALLLLDVAREIILADLPAAQAALKREAEERSARTASA